MSARCSSDWPPRLALLAGGAAMRLRPLTLRTPKSLVEVAGEPFLAHQLRLLYAGGIREIVLCCGYLGEQIRDFALDGSQYGLSIRYSFDGERPLGTGGALQAALPLLGSRFLVMYGDSWLSEPIEPVWHAFCKSNRPALMTVYPIQNHGGASNSEFRNDSVLRYDKHHSCPAMRHIDYGLNAMEARVLERWPGGAFDLAEVWSGLARNALLAGYEASDRFYEIGSFAGLRETEAVIAAARGLPQPRSLACRQQDAREVGL